MSQTMDKEKYIKEASEKFEALLREQIKRAEDMKNAAGAKDFAALPQITIGLCGGPPARRPGGRSHRGQARF